MMGGQKMKKNYTAPWAEMLEICEHDMITTSISVSSNLDGNDDRGDFDSLFG